MLRKAVFHLYKCLRCFGPIGDGTYLPEGEFFNSSDSPDIPMLFCTTFHEWGIDRNNPVQEAMTRAAVIQELEKQYGAKASSIYDAYSRNFPKTKPFEVLVFIHSNRISVVESAIAKKKQTSPVYMAWFGFEPPLFDGRIRAFHCLDISFWFLNTDLMASHSGGGARPRELSAKMADALLSFARTGDPNCPSLPHWPQFTAEKGETMILNDVCVVQDDPDKEGRTAISNSSHKK